MGLGESLLGNRPLLIVVSGPSGVGKTAVVDLLRERRPIRRSISATTRQPRDGERDGIDYHFMTVEAFRARINANDFAEWAQYDENYYGTLRKTVDDALEHGDDIVLTIEVQGGAQIRKAYPEALLVFLLPPTMESLRQRLAGRGTESEERLRERLNRAEREIQTATIYDDVLVNEDDGLEQTVAQLEQIIDAERHRVTTERSERLRQFRVD